MVRADCYSVFENILCTILTGRVYNITIEALHLILTVTLILVGGFIHMRKKDDLPECDVATTVSIIGNKWKQIGRAHV